MAQGAGPVLSAVGMVRENIVYDKDGQAYIPASQRPDGSWRKARRVKEGYIPPDEIPVYQSKGRLLAKEITPLSGYQPVDEDEYLTRLTLSATTTSDPQPLSRAQKKNARKKLKKKEKKAGEVAFEIEEVTSGLETVHISTKPSLIKPASPEKSQSKDTGNAGEEDRGEPKDKLKRERALRKKLKQIRELEERIASGDIIKPDKDQLTKIAKKADIETELLELSEDHS